MLLSMRKSKIHRVRITKKELNYQGSMGIDKELLDAAGMLENEKVQIVNLNNGQRFETYCIGEKKGSGTICLYGPAARLGEVGDIVIIISYCLMEPSEAEKLKGKVVHVDEKNRQVKC